MTDSGFRSDVELVAKARTGGRESFTALVRRYQGLVYGLCYHFLDNREDAMDAAQDSFITAYRRLGELRQQSDFRAWLRAIASNVCRERLRGRRTTHDLIEGSFDPFGRTDESLDLNRALDCLSSDTCLAVRLFYFEGNTVREIALFLGVTETTVMSRLRNARSQLRRDLETMFEPPTKRSSLPADFADRIPVPYDEYGPFPGTPAFDPLSDWRRQWLLATMPTGSSILSARFAGPEWESLPDSSVDVSVRLPDGDIKSVILKMSGRKDGVRTDAALLPLLRGFGLQVPDVVAGPSPDPALPGRGLLMATTPPLGQTALSWAVDGGTMAIDRACEVVMEGIELIKGLTRQVETSEAAVLLERCTLAEELARVVAIGGAWMTDTRFTQAIAALEPAVREIDEPLVFSDSGIGPNARVDAQGNLIGFESFSWARFEDPHYQISKYWTYDCWPVRRAGFVERYLLRHNLSMRDFAPRLGMRALVTLQREIPLKGGAEGYRNDMLTWLKLALHHL